MDRFHERKFVLENDNILTSWIPDFFSVRKFFQGYSYFTGKWEMLVALYCSLPLPVAGNYWQVNRLFTIKTSLKYAVTGDTAWKVSKYGIFSSPYFSEFRLGVKLRIQSEYRKIRTRKKLRIWTLFTQCETQTWLLLMAEVKVFILTFPYYQNLLLDLNLYKNVLFIKGVTSGLLWRGNSARHFVFIYTMMDIEITE